MKLSFLGTGAADWNFQEHKDLDGFRRNSSLLIDDCLLIDPGADVPNALSEFGKSIDEIKYIINTHAHSDHYNEQTLCQLSNAHFYSMNAGEVRLIGKYTVTALRANHSTCKSGAVHFIVSDGEKKLFYGLDGAWLMYDEVSAIKDNGIDLAIFDATIGDVPGDYRIFEHNNLNMVVEMKTTLEKYIKRFFISHMARTLHTSHDELVNRMKPHGIEVAFDGCEIEI
ncbi:MAG: MBL fold metallo-hydrolase [Clostridia bacterium]|nr:MBL fold metallo-hydrolase [Clostridia bacterium]